MHSFCPAVTKLLLERASREVEPTLAKNVQSLSAPDTQIIMGAESAIARKRPSVSMSALAFCVFITHTFIVQ